jgi:hypothetical protein
MTTVTQWFEIGKDGQPVRSGWYECAYSGHGDFYIHRWMWDGGRWVDASGGKLLFGNEMADYDRWRGLAEKPQP